MKDIIQLILDEDWPAIEAMIGNPASRPLRGEPDDIPPLQELAFVKWAKHEEKDHSTVAVVDRIADSLIRLGDTPKSIPEAAMFGWCDAVANLVAAGHSVDERDLYSTGLHVAARLGYVEIVRFLIANGASVTETDEQGRYAYDLADDPVVKEVLKEHGCRDKATDDEEYAAYCTARSDLNDLREVNFGFIRSTRRNDVAEMQRQLEKSTCKSWTLNIYFLPERETPLHIAVKAGHGNAVRFLLGAGADPNIRDQSGKTPLDYARELNSLDIIALFMNDRGGPNHAPEDTSLRADPQR